MSLGYSRIPIQGDNNRQTERWTFSGLTESNSDRGRLYVDIDATNVSVYSDVDQASGDLVAQGAHGSPTSWTQVTLSAQNASGLTGTVWVKDATADSDIILWVWLCSDEDLRSYGENDLHNWKPQSSVGASPSADTDFEDYFLDVMDEFIVRLKNQHPPRFVGRAAGASRQDIFGDIWRSNDVGDLELVGMHNIGDYRRWAIPYTLSKIYEAHQGQQGDYAAFRAEQLYERSKDEWRGLRPLVDEGSNRTANRRTRSIRVSRV